MATHRFARASWSGAKSSASVKADSPHLDFRAIGLSPRFSIRNSKCLDHDSRGAYGGRVPEVTHLHRRIRGDPSVPLPRRTNLPAFRRIGTLLAVKEAP